MQVRFDVVFFLLFFFINFTIIKYAPAYFANRQRYALGLTKMQTQGTPLYVMFKQRRLSEISVFLVPTYSLMMPKPVEFG